MLNTRLKYCLTAALSLSVMSFKSIAVSTPCGPGPHWIDDCPAVAQETTTWAFKAQIRIPCNSTAPTIVLRGPLKVQRDAGVPGVPAAPGAPGDPTHFLNTESLSLKFHGRKGITLRAGIEEGVAMPSVGTITELADDPRWAAFYTDYFYEVDIPRLGTLHAKDFCRVEGLLDRIPPPASVTHQPMEFPCSNLVNIPLFDEYDQEVGCLVTEGLD